MAKFIRPITSYLRDVKGAIGVFALVAIAVVLTA
jgi:hypothetical protein